MNVKGKKYVETETTANEKEKKKKKTKTKTMSSLNMDCRSLGRYSGKFMDILKWISAFQFATISATSSSMFAFCSWAIFFSSSFLSLIFHFLSEDNTLCTLYINQFVSFTIRKRRKALTHHRFLWRWWCRPEWKETIAWCNNQAYMKRWGILLSFFLCRDNNNDDDKRVKFCRLTCER